MNDIFAPSAPPSTHTNENSCGLLTQTWFKGKEEHDKGNQTCEIPFKLSLGKQSSLDSRTEGGNVTSSSWTFRASSWGFVMWGDQEKTTSAIRFALAWRSQPNSTVFFCVNRILEEIFCYLRLARKQSSVWSLLKGQKLDSSEDKILSKTSALFDHEHRSIHKNYLSPDRH